MKIGNVDIRAKRSRIGKTRYFCTFLMFLIIFSFSLSAYGTQKQDTSYQQPATSYQQDLTLSQRINNTFTPLVDALTEVLFFDPFAWSGV